MKNLRKKISIASIIAFGAILTSCSTTIEVAKKRHSKGYYVSISKGNKNVKTKDVESNNVVERMNTSTAQVQVEKTTIQPLQSEKTITVATAEKTTATNTTIDNSISEVKKPSLLTSLKSVKKLKKEFKKSNSVAADVSDSSDDVNQLLLLILAILLPPLAVFLVKGIGTAFWISLILTLLLFWLPGVIHAILVVLGMI